ncbi:MAG: nucleoside triphosphate pyrophosphohydrolase [Acidaminobacteraceae bacterium]
MEKYLEKEIIYNKLVRDFIPEVITRSNKSFTSHIATESEYKYELFKKLREETEELINEPCIEEIADILEVLDSIKKLYGFSDKEISVTKLKKLKERGGFEKGIVLETVKSK